MDQDQRTRDGEETPNATSGDGDEAKKMEQAQREAAEEREDEGGYQ
jgi:hypothetical protein